MLHEVRQFRQIVSGLSEIYSSYFLLSPWSTAKNWVGAAISNTEQFKTEIEQLANEKNHNNVFNFSSELLLLEMAAPTQFFAVLQGEGKKYDEYISWWVWWVSVLKL